MARILITAVKEQSSMAGSRKSTRSAKRARSRGAHNGSNGRASQAFSSTEELHTTPAIESASTQVVVRKRPVLKYSLIGIGVVALLLVAGGLGFAYWTVQKSL